MTSFWFYSVILLLIALLFIVVPIIRYRPVIKTADSEIRRQKNIEVFQESLAELEQDRSEDIISADEFEKLKTELQRSFLADMENAPGKGKQGAGKINALVPVLCLLFVPLFSYSLYQVVGSVQDLELPQIMQELSQAETADQQLAGLNRLAEALQNRFDRHDDDIQNGYMLGTLYLELENYEGAINTFASLAGIMEASPDKATVMGQLAQSMYLEAGSQITLQVQAIIDQVLSMNPNEFAVMSLLAIEAFINEDFSLALSYWRRQLIQMDANSQQAVVLRRRIEQVEALLPELAATGSDPQDAEGPSVSLIIELDDSIRDLVDDSMRLFIYARNPAMPMPLAAQNLSLPDFPFEITLDESMAMIENMTLASAQTVIVGARLTRSGQAIAQSGDIQAISDPFVLAEQTGPIRLTIKDIVP